MPSSRVQTIPTVIHIVQQLQPRSILDVGVGFGKWGHLFREYTDINAAEHDPGRYDRAGWQVRIDGIEGHAPYLTVMHHFLYNELHVGDALQLLPSLGPYDLIFMGDIIEHVAKATGRHLLAAALDRARIAVLITTPKFETGQGDSCGNPLERHRSLWSARDFKAFPRARVRTIAHTTLVALLLQPGVPPPEFVPGTPSSRLTAERMAQTRIALCQSLPADLPFILIDEEQLRSDLPHAKVFPFLEREGRFWGAPEDDHAAIAGLENLRGRGARYLALIWPTFWWLERYPAFADHLRRNFQTLRDDALLKVYDLSQGPEIT